MLAAPASAAPAATKLTLAGPSRAVGPGATATVTATLTSAGKALPGKSVTLYSGTTPVGTVVTDAKGRAAFQVQVTGPLRLQAGFAPAPQDAAAYAPASSKVLKLSPSTGLRVSIKSYLHAKRKSVGVPRVPVRVRGTVSPYTAGQQVQLSVYLRSKLVKRSARPVTPAGGGNGRFALSLRPMKRGVYRISAALAGTTRRRTTRLYVVLPSAHQGSRGTGVRALQSRLASLGYVTPVNGFYNSSTSRAVLAFRKVNGYARTTSASRAVFVRLARGRGAFHVRYPKAGKHAEFDWSRQVLVLARGARPDKVIHASSGKPSTPTIFGKFQFYGKGPGFNAKGMYYSDYFKGGYAVHGYSDVPPYAASHGCIRIPLPSAISVYRWITLGDTIYVYR